MARNDGNELRQIIDALSTASLLLEESRGMVLEPIARAVEAFASLPGIGPKTAQRLTFHLLRQPAEAVQNTGSRHGNLPGEIGRVTVRTSLPVTGRRCPGGRSACSRTPRNDPQLPQ